MALASVAAVVPMLIVFLNTSAEKTRGVSTELFRNAFSCIFIYTAMRRNGYADNKSYEKISVKKLLIPIIISIMLLMIINIATNFLLSNTFGFTFTLAAFLPDFNDWGLGTSEALFENHYFLFPLSALLQSITYAFFMVWGFMRGYKKREKVRKQMISK